MIGLEGQLPHTVFLSCMWPSSLSPPTCFPRPFHCLSAGLSLSLSLCGHFSVSVSLPTSFISDSNHGRG